MKFGLIHRIMTDALAALGLLALVTSGELPRAVSVTLLVALAVALFLPERWQAASLMRRVGTWGPLALLLVELARLFTGAVVLPLVIEFAAGLQVVRLATRRGAAHDQQVILLALLHLVAGTVLGGGLAYALCFLGFLVIAPGALVLSHLRREVEGNYRQGARDRTGLPVDVPRILRSRRVISKKFLAITCLLSVPIFLFTALLFVMFPRVGLSLLLLDQSTPGRMIGFSDKVDLGGVGTLRTNPTIAMRVEYPGLPTPPPERLALYLRGTAFDYYDGRSWSRTLTRRTLADRIGSAVRIQRFPDPQRDRRMTIDLEPIEPPVLFVPLDTISLKLAPRGAAVLGAQPNVLLGPEDELKYVTEDSRGIHYDVFFGPSDTRPEPLSAADRARYLALPPALPSRIAGLARQWAEGAPSSAARAKAIETHLRTDYTYNLDSPSGTAPNPLDDFLFNSKRGHCEYYSTAMAILLRTLGVPTRNVTGFIGGTYNRFGNFYAVRQGDAHSWVEVYLDDRGWTRFDPTPPGDSAPKSEITGFVAFLRDLVEASAQRWNRNVVGYDLKQQVSLFHRVRATYRGIRGKSGLETKLPRTGEVFAGLALVLGGAYLWRRRRRRATSESTARTPEQLAALQVVALYRALEDAMMSHGVMRQVGTPPLAHALALVELGHPIGAEVLALTELYLEVRFGERILTDAERRTFVERVRAVRQLRDTPRRAA
ncbi:MAG: DUF3488 and transglutaminase-like domain-containing protein [Sorangiineae bacterium]|nr:DUF3488 and transglutaminase-like domain-containing protein [Polyangiaceae bacterium]MEB2322916.1 DUF3488 and transglutaminase-like domain-containing protein [Sorangiineae bacterium]